MIAGGYTKLTINILQYVFVSIRVKWGVFYAPKFHIPCSDDFNAFFNNHTISTFKLLLKNIPFSNMIEMWMGEEYRAQGIGIQKPKKYIY